MIATRFPIITKRNGKYIMGYKPFIFFKNSIHHSSEPNVRKRLNAIIMKYKTGKIYKAGYYVFVAL
jgi:hypothetical protein